MNNMSMKNDSLISVDLTIISDNKVERLATVERWYDDELWRNKGKLPLVDKVNPCLTYSLR